MSKSISLRKAALTWLLSMILCFSMVPSAAFAAGEDSADSEVSAIDDNSSADEAIGRDVSLGQEEESVEVPCEDAFEANAVDADSSATEAQEAAAALATDQPNLGFLYIDEAALVVGDRQNVVFALSDEAACLAEAKLTYLTLSGEKSVEAARLSENAALFEIDCAKAGEYQLLGVEYTMVGIEGHFTESFEDDAYFFEVQGDESEITDVNVLTLDEQGATVEAEEIQETIEEAIAEPVMALSAAPMALSAAPSASSRATDYYPGIVVALDPGHGGKDSGATGNGLYEKNLTLSIAKYCRAALEREGISVFMTRTTDTTVELKDRVPKAVAAGASVFVSIHINSGDVTARGCEVWVPNNSSYNNDTHVSGEALGKKIFAKLKDLGLKPRDVKMLNSENGSKYPDGSIADYYTVINNARRNGIPGIIVEHAFISNAEDALKMKSEAFLKDLGEADAAGIIEAIRLGDIKGKGGLYNDGKGYRYKTAAGIDVVNGWASSGGKRYYFGADGYALRWEQKIDGKWYYFNGQSQMQTGWITWNNDASRSYFGADGVALTGWQTLSGKRYYFSPSTARSVRWEQKIDGKWYYFNGQSQMQTGWITWNADGSKSYFDPNASGAMLTGQATVNGTLYDFGADGKIRHKIMGTPQVTVAAMVADYKAHGKNYPTDVYTSKGAPTIEAFCELIYKEAKAEGVRPAVLYAQVMLETGWLQFGAGSVQPEQCNFGGIGATDSNPKPATFASVQMGLRAQAQHLKAYGSKDPLANACVDPRFGYVTRGVAPYVSDLSGRWASDKEYGIKLNKLIDGVMARVK